MASFSTVNPQDWSPAGGTSLGGGVLVGALPPKMSHIRDTLHVGIPCPVEPTLDIFTTLFPSLEPPSNELDTDLKT